VCKTYRISRATFYRWLKRFDPTDLNSLKNKSRRPLRTRRPRWSRELIDLVKQLRRLYPRWGKEKIAVLIKTPGVNTSASTVGRIIWYLKRRGNLVEPGQELRVMSKHIWHFLLVLRNDSNYAKKHTRRAS